MRSVRALTILSMFLLGAQSANAQSLFSGTWRPDPQQPSPDEPPEVIELANGMYDCQSCQPPFKMKADGTDQAVSNNPRFDSLNISVTDARTVMKTAKRGSATVLQSKTIVAPDGQTKMEIQTITGVAPHPIELAIQSTRISVGPPKSHAISGQWRVVEADLVNHDEDTTYKVDGNTLTMTDRLGRSFTAKLDGTDAPYKGDPRFTTVSLKLIDGRTLEETDKNGTRVVMINRWSIEPDGKTMHARFDDTHGHVQEQTGHKLP